MSRQIDYRNVLGIRDSFIKSKEKFRLLATVSQDKDLDIPAI
jgi:hypothetical protein